MDESQPTVYFIDDDPSVLDALTMLAETHDLNARAFRSAVEFLDCGINEPGCIVADLKMPELSGLELQAELRARGIEMPMIIVSGHINVESAVSAMRGGATDVLTKPFDNAELVSKIRTSLDHDQRRVAAVRRRRHDHERVETLTPREREVFDHLVHGLSGKQIAAELSISYRTMEKFRANVMRKTDACSVADLVHIAVRLDLIADGKSE